MVLAPLFLSHAFTCCAQRVPAAEAEGKIQKYIKTIEERQAAVDALYAGKDNADKFLQNAAQEQAKKDNKDRSAWVAANDIYFEHNWLGLGGERGVQAYYTFHIAALAASLDLIKKQGFAYPEDMKYLENGMAKWEEYEPKIKKGYDEYASYLVNHSVEMGPSALPSDGLPKNLVMIWFDALKPRAPASKFPIEIRGLDVSTPAKDQKAELARLVARMQELEKELDERAARIASLEDNYKGLQGGKAKLSAAAADLNKRLADARAAFVKQYPAHTPQQWQNFQMYGKGFVQMEDDVIAAKRSVEAADAQLAAAARQIGEAQTSRLSVLDALYDICKKIEPIETYRPVKFVEIDDEQGNTLASTKLKTLADPDKDLVALADDVKTARLTMEKAKPAKDKALASFQREEQSSRAYLTQLADLILKNREKKQTMMIGANAAKLGKAAFEANLAGLLVEGSELLCEKIIADRLERNEDPFEGHEEMQKSVEEEFKTQIRQDGNLSRETMVGLAKDEGGMMAAKVAVDLEVRSVRNLYHKSILLQSLVENPEVSAKEILKDHWSSLGTQAASVIVIAGVSYSLDKQEEDMWHDYYFHEIVARLSFAEWQVAAGTYWEQDYNKYEQLDRELAKRLEALANRQFEYETFPANFPVRTTQCANLRIAVEPGDSAEIDRIEFQPISSSHPAMLATRDKDQGGKRQYEFMVPMFNAAGDEQSCPSDQKGDSGYWVHVRTRAN
jgi:hypothetical protein